MNTTHPNIAARFFATVDKYGDKPAVGMAGEDAYLTYSQLGIKVRECAAYLGRLKPLEPIGLLSENRPEWGKVYFAILAAGGKVIPVDSLLKENELVRVFSESGMTRLFVSHKFLEIAERVASKIDNPPDLINLETIPTDNTSGFEPAYSNNGDDPAVLIFTSGTTGKSKKVILTHNNLLSNIEGILRRMDFSQSDKFLSVLPLHHTFEATCGLLTPLLNGCSVYYIKELNSREILGGMKKHKITIFIGVPLLFEKLYQGILSGIKRAPFTKRALFGLLMNTAKTLYSLTGKNAGRKLFSGLRQKAGLDSLRLMVSGSAPISVEIIKGFYLLGFNFIEGYGLTETSPVISANPLDKPKFGSVGPVLDNVEVRIDSPNENGVGEIIVKGPIATPGYEDNPEATSELWKDGWLHTGDLGYLDDENYLYICGRAKNLIVSAAGKNIYPEEIEAQLMQSPYIQEVVVYGKISDAGREEVAALVYPNFELLEAELGKKPEDITDDELKTNVGNDIRRLCADIADFKRVKHIRYTREELEKTSTKKIKRYVY
ncbi:MAG: AMP-binding protein [candidate division Zixibacteria bacterium]